jgi:hypothetical protein
MRGAHLIYIALDRTSMTLAALHNDGNKGGAKGFSEIQASTRKLPVGAGRCEVGAASNEMLPSCSGAE